VNDQKRGKSRSGKVGSQKTDKNKNEVGREKLGENGKKEQWALFDQAKTSWGGSALSRINDVRKTRSGKVETMLAGRGGNVTIPTRKNGRPMESVAGENQMADESQQWGG